MIPCATSFVSLYEYKRILSRKAAGSRRAGKDNPPRSAADSAWRLCALAGEQIFKVTASGHDFTRAEESLALSITACKAPSIFAADCYIDFGAVFANSVPDYGASAGHKHVHALLLRGADSDCGEGKVRVRQPDKETHIHRRARRYRGGNQFSEDSLHYYYAW